MSINKSNLMILLTINIIIPLLSSVIAKEQGVPVLIWSNYEDITFPGISSIDYLSQKNFIKDILEKTSHSDVKLITFVQERLSLEDFTSHNSDELHNLDNILNNSLSSYFLTNVENPIAAIEESRERSVKQNSLNGLDEADGDSIVIVDLPSASDLVANDAIIGKMTQDIGKIHDKTIVMLTGRENSYADEEIHRVARHIMAEPKSSKVQSEESGYLVEVPAVNPCLFMYNIGVSFVLKTYEGKDRSKPPTIYSSSFAAKPSSSVGKCAEHDESGKEQVPASLKLTWNTDGTKLSLDFTISVSKRGYYWEVKKVEANVENGKVKKRMFLNAEKMEAASGFSFSCKNLTLCNDWNVTDDTLTYFQVHLSRFQFQPFASSSKTKKFDESFDCSTFFTIPLWMGLFTMLLFITIVCVGVFLLMELSTMDRFENPKGKTITINVTD